MAALIPQTLQAQPAGPGDWSQVRLFGHAFRNDDFTPEQYDFIRDHYAIFTIEKRHAKNIYGATSTEKAAAATAKKLLKNNPDMRVLLYWSTNTAYSRFYTTVRDTVAQHPDWVEEVREGTVRWTYPNVDARNWWADTADQLVNDSALNGVFGDGAPGANARGQLESVESCLKRLSSFVIFNGYRVQTSGRYVAGASTLAHADGVFCEAFFRSSVETADEGVKLMEELLAIPSGQIHSLPRSRGRRLWFHPRLYTRLLLDHRQRLLLLQLGRRRELLRRRRLPHLLVRRLCSRDRQAVG